MNAVRSATRAACCMLWVTITIVTRFLSSSISSSIRSVAIGSSAEHGSSIRITSGSTASERAMHRRCCCPPERPAPGSERRSLTSSHRPAPRSADSTLPRTSPRRPAVRRSPAATLSKTDIVGNGLGFWKTMPIARRTATTSTAGSYTFASSSSTRPSACAPGISSCMRLMQRIIVDLPQPEGPMIAVTSLARNSRSMPFTCSALP